MSEAQSHHEQGSATEGVSSACDGGLCGPEYDDSLFERIGWLAREIRAETGGESGALKHQYLYGALGAVALAYKEGQIEYVANAVIEARSYLGQVASLCSEVEEALALFPDPPQGS